jgi:hypothetical protein
MVELAAIVSCYKQPEHLWVCLASLRLQREIEKPWGNIPLEIIVVDDAQLKENEAVALHYGCKYIPTDFGDCYASTEVGIKASTAPYICFPSHDNWYVPEFAARMLSAIESRRLDLVYCDMLHDPRYTGKYMIVHTKPVCHRVDKGGLVVKRGVFDAVGGFTGKAKTKGERTVADGILVETINNNPLYRCGRVDQVMLYHG